MASQPLPNNQPTSPTRPDLSLVGDRGRVPPQDLEAEEAVLGAMLLRREVIGEVLQIVKPEMFFVPKHQMVFQTLVDLYERNSQIDPLVVKDELARRDQFSEVGGNPFLVQIMERVPEVANASYYAKIVRNKAVLRDLIRAAGDIRDQAYADRGETELLLDAVEQKMFDVTQQRVTGKAEHIRGILQEAYKQLQHRGDGYYTGLPSGFTELDDLLSGFQAGEMIIIAARPSMGKTAFALNVTENIGVNQKRPVLFFSMEMSKNAVAQRMLCAKGNVDSHKLRRGMLGEEDIARLGMVAADLGEAPIFIDDTPGQTVLQVKAKARQLKAQHDIACIAVDYLQLMREPGAENRVQEITTISSGLKAMARELDVPVLAVAQLNRSAEVREGHRPRMSDLRESGALEQDADVVLLLHRPDYYNAEDEAGTAELIVAKQRNGPTGDVKLQFDKARTRFNNLALPQGHDF